MSEEARSAPHSLETREGRACNGAVPCAHCQRPVDPLRAARVAIYHERFWYFCSAECRDDYRPSCSTPIITPSPAAGETSERRSAASVPVERTHFDQLHAAKRALLAVGDELVERTQADVERSATALVAEPAIDWQPRDGAVDLDTQAVSPPQDLSTPLLVVALMGGILAIALLLTGDSGVTLTARLVVAWIAWSALVAHSVTTRRDAACLHPSVLLAGPTASILLTTVARIWSPAEVGQLLSLSGVIFATTAADLWWTGRARTPIEAERRRIGAVLDVEANRVVGEDVTRVSAGDLRSGEEIVVGEGEVVPADGTIVAGTAEVTPWAMAAETVTRSEGEHVVAGARVKRGRARIVVSWTGNDRAWARLAIDQRRRADLHTNTARLGRLIAERGAPIAAGACALLTFASDQSSWQILASAIAGQAVFSNTVLSEIGAWWVSRAVHIVQRRGIALRTPEAIDRASRVTAAVFCARGTLLLGEPEIASIDPFGTLSTERVLELAAGAHNGAAHPTAMAVLRAARQRGIRPDAVRSPAYRPGLGVTAIASDGQPLVVGSRGLMLREHVSVALAEPKIGKLEATGQTVLLVAMGGRLVGVLGLQDGLRPGARAAVQHLIDVGIEPILLSGDTRDTCEALGRALDIDHVRAEVLPTDRGDEIRLLADGGAVTAVIGRSPVDDSALANADVSVSLATAGSGSSEWQIQLATDDVRDAAFALRTAHQCRSETRIGLALTVGSSGLGALLVALSMVPLSLAPILGFVGGTLALLRWQTTRE
jgi:P-type Cu+ transporter